VNALVAILSPLVIMEKTTTAIVQVEHTGLSFCVADGRAVVANARLDKSIFQEYVCGKW
jgi:hypothetical protein